MIEIDNACTLKSSLHPISCDTPCLFGVSVARSVPDVDALRSGWAWTRERFTTHAMLIGDSLVGLTLQASDGLSPEAARRAGRWLTAKLMADFEEWNLGGSKIVRTSDVVGRPQFHRWRETFTDTFQRSAAFRGSVNHDATRYCRRQESKGALMVPIAKAIEISTEYLLDEIAVYSVLAEDGWLAEAYLGSELGTLARLIRGTLPDVAPILERRTHLSLKPRSIRRAA